MTIEILPSEVVDQIAAGEVVERPAHMVKELVENALDAGATDISVEFSNGGRLVKVSDNGSGMSPSDLPKAFLRFATSKIKKSDDLWNLGSFGFRGEALASISSVSRVTLFSSSTDDGLGYRITSQFGALSPLEPVNRSRGTTILIENLFQNVPARLKFMKGDAAESAQIKNILKALAMAHSEVSIRVLQEGKLLFYWPGTEDQKKRIESILEISPLYEGRASRGSVEVRAYFTDPHEVSRVSRNIWFFAQNRYIQDRSLQAAVMEAYRNLLMHGEYPYVVCFLNTVPSDIDVNIHPTKSQVKFLYPQDAFRAVQKAIRTTLERAPWLVKNERESIGVVYTPHHENSISEDRDAVWGGRSRASAGINLKFNDPSFEETRFRQKDGAPVTLGRSPTPERVLGANLNLSEFGVNVPPDGTIPSEPLKTATLVVSETKPYKHWSLLQVIGQAGLTYLVCQSEKGLVLIDQHAAHERVAFERLMTSWKQGHLLPIQTFLFPLSIDLSEEKVEALRPFLGELEKLGIEIEELGPFTLGIKSAPQLLKDRVLVQEIERMAQEVIQWGDSPLIEKAIADICARLACHSVMRAGQSLSRSEMEKLLEEMDEHPLSSFCPHGRPVSVSYSWVELEKDFGRRL